MADWKASVTHPYNVKRRGRITRWAPVLRASQTDSSPDYHPLPTAWGGSMKTLTSSLPAQTGWRLLHRLRGFTMTIRCFHSSSW